MATGPLQPIKTPPLLSPLATAAAQELRERARHPILHGENVLSLLSPAACNVTQRRENSVLKRFIDRLSGVGGEAAGGGGLKL